MPVPISSTAPVIGYYPAEETPFNGTDSELDESIVVTDTPTGIGAYVSRALKIGQIITRAIALFYTPLEPDELAADKADFAGLSLRELLIKLVNEGGGGVTTLPTTDIYDVPDAVRTAVAGSTNYSTDPNTYGELLDAEPAGSTTGMKFKKGQAKYEFMRGDSGLLVWVRSPVG